jgi:multiple sugar transport system ATP-binding protein
MAAISIRGLRKSYGAAEVLRGIDLEVKAGEFVVLVGPSGCGKSTLLRLIAGLETASSGDIRIDGKLVNGLAPKDRDIAMVFQILRALSAHERVREHEPFRLKTPDAGARPTSTPACARRPRSSSWARCSSASRASSRAASGRGSPWAAPSCASPRCSCSTSRSATSTPSCACRCGYEIKRLQRELAVTSIYVTHDQVEAMTLADRLIVMNAGVAEQIGTPMDVYDNPATTFVAGFIGSPAMNYLGATLMRAESGDMLDLMLGTALLARVPRPAAWCSAGERVTVGLRPERIAMGAPAEGIAAQVELSEPTGLGVVLHLSFAGQRLTVFTSGRPQARVNDWVGLRVAAADILLFDASSGVRLR